MMKILEHCNISPEGLIEDSMYSVFRTGVRLIEDEKTQSVKNDLINELLTLVGFIDYDPVREDCLMEMLTRGYITSLKNLTSSIEEDDEVEIEDYEGE